MGLDISQINIGAAADDQTGESIRGAFTKVNNNFSNTQILVNNINSTYANTIYAHFSNVAIDNIVSDVRMIGTMYINDSPVATVGTTFPGGVVPLVANFSNSTQSTTTTNGALYVPYGGVGIGKTLNVGGYGVFSNATNSTTSTTGAVQIAGGLGVAKNAFIGQNLNVDGSTTLASVNTSDVVSVGSSTVSTAYNNGALVVTGGVGVGQNLNVQGNITVGNLSILTSFNLASSASFSVGTFSTSDSLMDLHKPYTGSLSVDDGYDIGLVFNYYKVGTGASRAALVWANDTTHLEYYGAGVETSGIITGGVYGTGKFGEFWSVNTTPSTSSTTGAIRTAGGISSEGNIIAGGNIIMSDGLFWSNGVSYATSTAPTFTSTANVAQYGQVNAYTTQTFYPLFSNTATTSGNTTLGVNSDFTFNATSGNLTSPAGLVSTTHWGAVAATTANVSSGAASTSTTTGALVVTGGVGVGGVIQAGGNIVAASTAVSSSTTTGALVVVGGLGVGGSINIPSTQFLDLSNNGGTRISRDGTLNGLRLDTNSTTRLFISDSPGNVIVTSTTTSGSASTGALVVSGGVGISGNIYIGSGGNSGNIYMGGSGLFWSNGVSYATSTASAAPNFVATANVAQYGQVNAYTTQTFYPLFSNTATNSGNTTLGVNSGLTFNATSGNLTSPSGLVSTTLWGAVAATTANVSGVSILNGNVVAASGTTSSSTTTGALVVSGGAGISGAIYMGGSGLFWSNGVSYATSTASAAPNFVATANVAQYGQVNAYTTQTFYPLFSNTATNSGNTTLGVDSTFTFNATTGNLVTDGFVGTHWGAVAATTANVSSGAASSSTTSGALVVTGGVGIGSNLYIGGSAGNAIVTSANIYAGNLSVNTNVNVSGNAYIGNLNISGNIYGNVIANSGSVDVLYAASAVYIGGVAVSVQGGSATYSSINNTVIGNITPRSGAFTTLSATSGITGTLQTASQTNITAIGTLTSLNVSGATNAVGGLTASTVSAGTIGNSGSTLTGTLSTAAQTNITSVGTLSGLTSTGNIVAASSTASTSTTTGALVVSGGAGISGAIYMGGAGLFWSNGVSYATSTASAAPNFVATANVAQYGQVNAYTTQTFYPTFSNTATTSGNTTLGVNSGLTFNATSGNLTSPSGLVSTTLWGAVAATTANVSSGAASTSTTTGALVVTGGVGIGNNLNVGANVNIGANGRADTNFYNAKNITGATTAYANFTNAIVQSDVTSQARGYLSTLSTAAASFTLGTLRHFHAAQGTIGAGSAVTTQYGFLSENNLIDATTNYAFVAADTAAVTAGKTAYGFVSTINTASGGGTTYAFYAAGNAANYFGGSLRVANSAVSTSTTTGALVVSGGAGISGNLNVGGPSTIVVNSTVDALRITQSGAGNCLVVEDTTNPDSTPFVIDTNGSVGIGTATPNYKLEVNGSFAATTKSFVIKHPSRTGMMLRYGSLEGPENGVYIRGRLSDSNVIELPDYWVQLVDPDSITVNLTPIGQSQDLHIKDIANNKIIIGSSKSINCFFTVFAERVDVEKLKVEIEAESD